MRKFIIVEGVDGSGKSTLIDVLSKTLNVPVAKRAVTSEGGPPADLNKWFWKELDREDTVIYDRFPAYSDPIYSTVLNRKRLIGPAAVRYFKDHYSPFLIVCDPGWLAVSQAVLRNEQMPGVMANLEKLYAQYRAIPDVSYRYNHTNPQDYPHLLKRIHKYLAN